MKKLVKRLICKVNDMVTRMTFKATEMFIKSRTILCSQRGEGFVDTASASVRA